MRFTYPPDEKIVSYEHLYLEKQTDKSLVYKAYDDDFLVKEVVLDRRALKKADESVPKDIVVSVSWD